MADTVHCYNENEVCETCEQKPVQINHSSDHTDHKLKKLCNPCFVDLITDK